MSLPSAPSLFFSFEFNNNWRDATLLERRRVYAARNCVLVALLVALALEVAQQVALEVALEVEVARAGGRQEGGREALRARGGRRRRA